MAPRLLCLLLLAGACRVKEEPAPPLPLTGDAGAAPARTVVSDYPPGLSQPAADAGVVDVASGIEVMPDPLVVVDASAADAQRGCSLLVQDCAEPTLGCYPGATGAGECRPAGRLPEGDGCLARDDECRQGLLCVAAFGLGQGRTCQRICDPASTTSCKPGPKCVAFPGSSIGWCPP